MKESTRNYAQKVQQALLNLLDPVLIGVMQIFCLYANRQPAVIKHGESKHVPEGWRGLMIADSQHLRNMLHGFSPEDIYHQIVLLAANAFAIRGKNEQQKHYLITEQGHGFHEFMKFLVSWLENLAGREEVGELIQRAP